MSAHGSKRLRRCVARGCAVAGVVGAMAAATYAGQFEVQRRLDLSAALGHPAQDARIRALAHDGTHLWLLAPSADRLLQVRPSDGSLVGSYPLHGTGTLSPAGMAFGAGDLWLADSEAPRLLRLSREGSLRDAVDLSSYGGVPVGVDFHVGEPGGAGPVVEVALRGLPGGADRLQPFEVGERELRPLPALPMDVPGSGARASMNIEGVRHVWVVAPREPVERLEGDAWEEWPVPIEDLLVPPPDDRLPRGGEDLASTYRLTLVDPEQAAVVLEVFPKGPSDGDTTSFEQTLYATEGLEVAVAVVPVPLPIEYGPPVCRRVELFYSKDFESTVDDVFVHFANPWDKGQCTDPSCNPFEKQATGGYLAQEVVSLLDEHPPGSIFYTQDYSVGSGTLLRHGRKFGFGDNVSGPVAARYEIETSLRSAVYNVVPSQVGPLAWVPENERDLYTHDGDNDSFGDDNPATDIDDYFALDSPEVHDHLLASGAMDSIDDLYYAVRKILHYVKRRHAYNSCGNAWGKPDEKLESPYATCSSSAFMVVALAREAGIPARLVGTTKQRGSVDGGAVVRDIHFHRWAQVLLPGYGWLRVDATPDGPKSVGFVNVNGDVDPYGDDVYDCCDICVTDAQCQADYGKSFADCGITLPFTNPNDVTGDGVVNGDDVAIIGAGYYTPAKLDSGLFPGVGTSDLITWVAPGVREYDTDPQDPLHLHYVSGVTYTGEDGTGAVDNYADWRSCHDIGVIDVDPIQVNWELFGEFDPAALVRIDLYRLTGVGTERRYRHVARLAVDVPARDESHPIDLTGIDGNGEHVVVVTHQGEPRVDRLTSLPTADWETYGASAPFLLPEMQDTDGDGITDSNDNCTDVPNPDQLDTDGDGRGDACDDDDDDDRVPDVADNCPTTYNPGQDDTDQDGHGDACDNCVRDPNPEQSDLDGDGEGDRCDLNDGLIFVFSSDPSVLEWQPEVGFTSWNSYRGDLAVLKATGVYTQEPGSNDLADRDCGLREPRRDDPTIPASGQTAFYLTTGNGPGGESTLGTDSAGTTRPNHNPCP